MAASSGTDDISGSSFREFVAQDLSAALNRGLIVRALPLHQVTNRSEQVEPERPSLNQTSKRQMVTPVPSISQQTCDVDVKVERVPVYRGFPDGCFPVKQKQVMILDTSVPWSEISVQDPASGIPVNEEFAGARKREIPRVERKLGQSTNMLLLSSVVHRGPSAFRNPTSEESGAQSLRGTIRPVRP
jgi:hypothetical protein